jgi:hypothetical protein
VSLAAGFAAGRAAVLGRDLLAELLVAGIEAPFLRG